MSDERQIPAEGQVWRVGEVRWYLRRRTAGSDGRAEFLAVEVNGKRRATLTQEFLEDSDGKSVEYLSTPEVVNA